MGHLWGGAEVLPEHGWNEVPQLYRFLQPWLAREMEQEVMVPSTSYPDNIRMVFVRIKSISWLKK